MGPTDETFPLCCWLDRHKVKRIQDYRVHVHTRLNVLEHVSTPREDKINRRGMGEDLTQILQASAQKQFYEDCTLAEELLLRDPKGGVTKRARGSSPHRHLSIPKVSNGPKELSVWCADPSYSFSPTTGWLHPVRPLLVPRILRGTLDIKASSPGARIGRIYGGPRDPNVFRSPLTRGKEGGKGGRNLFRRGRRSLSCNDPETS